jgi:NADH-quinone oxidoreductase subunit L
MDVAGFSFRVAFSFDALALVMVLVITVVGLLIHLYSAGFMADDPGCARFFSFMNLFVGSMLVLVLADNLLLLYLGWEGVGLCSYLLVGFWYREPENGLAARKAFLMTRVGDAAMAVGLFVIATNLGTLEIREAMHRAAQQWTPGSAVAVTAAALLLCGALGKSAQLPLQAWLPDAMAGPTPVSALIHAATMVTAGVYLIARTQGFFLLAPQVLSAVAVIGGLTLLLAGFSALCQRSIKRVLAYSTMSQVGYMFLSLGVGAWSAALFHFATHACFKALLFLGAGSVIYSLDHEQDMFRMGGLRKELPTTFRTFLVGAAALSALPFLTAGFYSKESILAAVWSSERGGAWLWAAGAFGSFLTALYTFRMVFLTFAGDRKLKPEKRPGSLMLAPLVVLALFSLVLGLFQFPPLLGGWGLFKGFIGTALVADSAGHSSYGIDLLLFGIVLALQVSGIYLASLFFLRGDAGRESLLRALPFAANLQRFWSSGWGFDRLYLLLFSGPYVRLSRANRKDALDLPFTGAAWYCGAVNRILRCAQNGKIGWYAMGIAFGTALVLALVVFR